MDIANQRRRLVKRHMAVGQMAQEALAVSKADSAGIVDGVHVDFRHSGISPGQWEARAFWYVGNDSVSHAGFLFPSEAEACEGLILQQSEDHYLELEKLQLPRAHAGDLITVESVIDRISDNRFDHLHDRIVKDAHLILTRPNGETIRPSTPLSFYGVTQMKEGPTRDAYDRLAERILSGYELENPGPFQIQNYILPNESRLPAFELTLLERAVLAIENAERAWKDLADNHLQDDLTAQSKFRRLMANVALAGFFQAKHEPKPAEQRAQRVAEGGDKGRNKAKAKDNRLAYAREEWDKDPSLTISALSRRVIGRLHWQDDLEMIAESSMTDSLKRSIDRDELIPPDKGSGPTL